MQGRPGRALVSFLRYHNSLGEGRRRVSRAIFDGFRRVREAFREVFGRPKSIFWRLFRGVFRDRDSGGIFSGFWEGPKLKNSNFP